MMITRTSGWCTGFACQFRSCFQHVSLCQSSPNCTHICFQAVLRIDTKLCTLQEKSAVLLNYPRPAPQICIFQGSSGFKYQLYLSESVSFLSCQMRHFRTWRVSHYVVTRFQSINSPKADWPPHWVAEPRLVDPRQAMPVERALLGRLRISALGNPDTHL